MERELGIGRSRDLLVDVGYRDRLLMIDEMEETAQAIRARAVGFDDVAEEQARKLEAALSSLRQDFSRRFGDPPAA